MESNGEFQESLFIGDDNEDVVDFVLVWDSNSKCADANSETRQVFESNLAQEGLVLSRHEHFETGLHFVKIHAPTEVLKRYAEILKLRFPMKKVRSTRLKYNTNHKGKKLLFQNLLDKLAVEGSLFLHISFDPSRKFRDASPQRWVLLFAFSSTHTQSSN